MKKILMLCLALVMGVGMCAAQKAADKKTVTTVFTTDIDCEHCVKKIMNNVPSLGKGVKDVKVDLPKKEVTVVYDSTKNSDENIVKGFASIKSRPNRKKPTRRNNAGGFCYRKGRTSLSSLLFRLLGGLLYCRRFPPIRYSLSAIRRLLSTVRFRTTADKGRCMPNDGRECSAGPESARLPVCPVYRCGCPFVFMALCLRLRR